MKARWKVPEKETGCLGSAASSPVIPREHLPPLRCCLLTQLVWGGVIFHFAELLGGYLRSHLATCISLTSPLTTFLFAHSPPARCLFLPCLAFASAVPSNFMGLASHYSRSVCLTPPLGTQATARTLTPPQIVLWCSYSPQKRISCINFTNDCVSPGRMQGLMICLLSLLLQPGPCTQEVWNWLNHKTSSEIDTLCLIVTQPKSN